MATSKDFADFVVGQFNMPGRITLRKMMGEYVVYFDGKVIGDICDDRLLLKITPSSRRLLPDADTTFPYEGAAKQMLCADVDNTPLLQDVANAMFAELEFPKKRASKKQPQ